MLISRTLVVWDIFLFLNFTFNSRDRNIDKKVNYCYFLILFFSCKILDMMIGSQENLKRKTNLSLRHPHEYQF